MISNINQAKILSDKYHIPYFDILMIGLNIIGINYKSENKSMSRGRFRLYPNDKDRFFLAVAINPNSPYVHDGNHILLEKEIIGKADTPENDTCDDTYFRKNGKALTLNSNNRSKCLGCKFCGTYILNDENVNNLTTPERLSVKLEKIIKENKLNDLSSLEQVGIVTGCFNDEEEATNHIIMVKDVFENYNFNGEIQYIGSQIISPEALDKLAKKRPIGLYFTVECFDRREYMMKPSKSTITLEKGRNVLKIAKEKGMETSFLYILGLDSISKMEEEFQKYKEVVTRHPVINLMQNYTPNQNSLRDPDAHKIEYYLESRLLIEKVFKQTGMRPRLWENYRAPWSTRYGGEKLNAIGV